MIGISKLYCGAVEPGDVLRYDRDSSKLPSDLLQFSRDKKPVVVWNCTQKCNLKCVHCYAQSEDRDYAGEMSTDEAKVMIDDLASWGAPVLLFSGGEPTLRRDLLELMRYAKGKGMRVVISTNGTQITPEKAAQYAEVGLSYVGVSLDGGPETHDKFRGIPGSFDKAIAGIRNSMAAGIKVGLRMTINKRNWQDINALFDVMEAEKIPRACFYHLVYAGRGSELMKEDLDHEETRKAVRLIMDRTKAMFDKGLEPEILTVDNHADGPFLYMEMLKEDPERAADVLQLLEWNQGNSTGNGIGCVSWNGEVYADQFWRHFSFGNVRQRPFSEIWTDVSGDTEQSELMKRLKDKRPYVKGRCAECQWLQICGGNFRVRAEAATGDLWNPDPACYLTDEEIGIGVSDHEAADLADRAEAEVAVAEGMPIGGEAD
jgi:12,18-didecarboxysiroheme deacetylase